MGSSLVTTKDRHLPDSSMKEEPGECLNYLICLRNVWIDSHKVFKKEKKKIPVTSKRAAAPAAVILIFCRCDSLVSRDKLMYKFSRFSAIWTFGSKLER